MFQSDTFAEGERPEENGTGVEVSEKLSREGSPVPEVKPDILEPGTPERSRPCMYMYIICKKKKFGFHILFICANYQLVPKDND